MVNEVRTALAASMTEAQLLANVRAEAKRQGWLCYHTHRSDRSEKGYPDLTLVRGGTVMWVELKSEKGRLSAEQKEWLAALGLPWLKVAVWRPQQWYDGTIERVLL